MTKPHKGSYCCCIGDHADIHNDNDDSDDKYADIVYGNVNETDDAQKGNLRAKFQLGPQNLIFKLKSNMLNNFYKDWQIDRKTCVEYGIQDDNTVYEFSLHMCTGACFQ
jgi:hypothetical protein